MANATYNAEIFKHHCNAMKVLGIPKDEKGKLLILTDLNLLGLDQMIIGNGIVSLMASDTNWFYQAFLEESKDTPWKARKYSVTNSRVMDSIAPSRVCILRGESRGVLHFFGVNRLAFFLDVLTCALIKFNRISTPVYVWRERTHHAVQRVFDAISRFLERAAGQSVVRVCKPPSEEKHELRIRGALESRLEIQFKPNALRVEWGDLAAIDCYSMVVNEGITNQCIIDTARIGIEKSVIRASKNEHDDRVLDHFINQWCTPEKPTTQPEELAMKGIALRVIPIKLDPNDPDPLKTVAQTIAEVTSKAREESGNRSIKIKVPSFVDILDTLFGQAFEDGDHNCAECSEKNCAQRTEPCASAAGEPAPAASPTPTAAPVEQPPVTAPKVFDHTSDNADSLVVTLANQIKDRLLLNWLFAQPETAVLRTFVDVVDSTNPSEIKLFTYNKWRPAADIVPKEVMAKMLAYERTLGMSLQAMLANDLKIIGE